MTSGDPSSSVAGSPEESRVELLRPPTSTAEHGAYMDRRAINFDVQRLSVVNPWRSMTALTVQWIVIATATAVVTRSHHPLVIVVAICVIATRQHALAILMHEGAHFRLCQHRMMNDVMSNLMAGFWLGIVTSLYRDSHLRHHQHATTLNDPDWVLQADMIDWHWPKGLKEAVTVLLVDLTGVHFVKMFVVFFWQWAPWGSRADVANGRVTWSRMRNWRHLGKVNQTTFVVFVAVVAALAWQFTAAREFLAVWVTAMTTVLMLLLRIRGIAEHHGVRNHNELDNTRTVIAPWYERLMIAPCNVSYHLEHHLFPSVPFHNLPTLHRLLMRDDEFRTRSQRAVSYLHFENGVLRELTSPSTDGSSRSNPRDVLRTR